MGGVVHEVGSFPASAQRCAHCIKHADLHHAPCWSPQLPRPPCSDVVQAMLKGLKMLRELMEAADRGSVSSASFNYYGSGYAAAAAGMSQAYRVWRALLLESLVTATWVVAPVSPPPLFSCSTLSAPAGQRRLKWIRPSWLADYIVSSGLLACLIGSDGALGRRAALAHCHTAPFY